MDCNCYILGCEQTKKALIIDPGDNANKISSALKTLDLKPEMIINTHGHIDHIMANKELGLPVYIHKLDAEYLTNPNLNFSGFVGTPMQVPPPDGFLEHGQKVSVGNLELEVIHTPGHTPGGLCLMGKGVLLAGDTLFHQGIGRTDIPGSSQQDLSDSLSSKLFKLDNDMIVYPGHGPSTTIGEAREYISAWLGLA